jgi:hypothetical protein
MEQFNIPEELTRETLRQIIERVFAVYDPNDEMKESLLLFAEHWKPLWTMKHIITYMNEKNWSFPHAFKAVRPNELNN